MKENNKDIAQAKKILDERCGIVGTKSEREITKKVTGEDTYFISPSSLADILKENSLWKKFFEYGSGFNIGGNRDYHTKGYPLVFHLFMYGIIYPDGYELVGNDLEKLIRQAMKDGDRNRVRLSTSKKTAR